MRRFGRNLTAGYGSLLVLAVLAFVPSSATAGWIGFRNETGTPVVVQITHVAQPREQHGKPHLIHPNNVTWEAVLQPGAKRITVYNATQPRQVLFQGPLNYTGNDLFFAIQMEAAGAGAAPAPLLQKLKLTPAKPPALPGQMPPGP